MDQSMEGKVAIVTGSSKGIGRAVAEQLGTRGARIVINARSPEHLAEVEAEMQSQGFDVLGIPLNVTSESGPSSLVDQAVDHYGRVDLVVNMVAINPYYGPLMDVTREAFAKIMTVNTWTAVAVVQAAVRRGLADDGGSVVNVSTIGARQYQPELGPYCASKAALEVLTIHMASELGPRGIRVNGVAPGLVRTEMAQALWQGEYGAFEESVLPLRRLGEPEDIAAAILYLLSDDSSWTTGTVLIADGGRLATSLTYSPGSAS